MSRCKNSACDEVRAAALQVAGVWDTLLESAANDDPDAGEVVRHLKEEAPHVVDSLQRLSEALVNGL